MTSSSGAFILHIVVQNDMERIKVMPEQILRLRAVMGVTSMSRSTIYKRIEQGLFPRPIQLGVRMIGWRESEVAKINAARIRGESSAYIRALVTQLEAERGTAA